MSVNNSPQTAPDRRKQTIEINDVGELPSCTDHAKLRWIQRGGSHTTGLREAWLDGFHVGDVSRGGTARLHPPTKTILVETEGNIVTVLQAEYTPFTDGHLVICDECDLKYQPTKADRSCPWCGYNVDSGDDSIQADDPEPAQFEE